MEGNATQKREIHGKYCVRSLLFCAKILRTYMFLSESRLLGVVLCSYAM